MTDLKELLYEKAINSFTWIEVILIDFIKKYWKEILAVLLIVSLFFAVRSCNEYKKEATDVQTATGFNDSLSAQIKYWHDRYGKEHSKTENLTVAVGRANNIIDSVSFLLNIKSKQIVALSKSKLNISLNQKPKVDTVFQIMACPANDSLKVVNKYKFTWHDAWMNVNGVIGNNEDSIHVFGVDTIGRVDYSSRKWFLGAVHNYVDFTNSNPHINVSAYNGINFIDSKKQWNVSAMVMLGYPVNEINVRKPSVMIGIGIGKTLFRF